MTRGCKPKFYMNSFANWACDAPCWSATPRREVLFSLTPCSILKRLVGSCFCRAWSHTWPGSVGWEYEVAALPGIGQAFTWTMVAAGYRLMASRAAQAVFNPDTPPEDYLDHAGIMPIRLAQVGAV